jgi:hypothetical protein
VGGNHVEINASSQTLPVMKGIFAAIIAIVILWFVDANFNGGGFTLATVRMARTILSQIGIHI